MNLYTRFFLLVAIFLLGMCVVNGLNGAYGSLWAMLVVAAVCLGVYAAFPTAVVFDRESLQVRYVLGFYESFAWEQLQWLEPCTND